jgi:hypothetical protein
VIIASTHGRTDDGRRQWWDRKKSLSPLFSRRNLSAQTFKTLAGAVNQVRLPRKSLFQVFFLATIRLFVARAKKHLQIECNHNLTTTGGRLFEQGTCKLLFVCKLVNTYVPRYIYPVRVKDDFLFNLETV